MQSLAESGIVKTIVVKDLSRFGRNYIEVGEYLEIKYLSLGVRLISIQENVDTSQNTGAEMMPFHNIFNEWYAAQTSKKIRRVQELRQHKRRPTSTERTSLFLGLVYCPDCGAKLHFAAAKSMTRNQEHFRCANYKSGRGDCQIRFIRDIVLERIVFEAISNLADFVRCYEPVFLYLMATKNQVIRKNELTKLKHTIETGKRRISELDMIISRIYEDNILGKISDERYSRMVSMYETEQKELIKTISSSEKELKKAEQQNIDMRLLLKTLRKLTDFRELTPTIVNSLIQRIEVHNNDKYDGHCHVKVDIYFTAVGMIDIPDEKEILDIINKIQDNPQMYKVG